ncbi:phospholipase D-like domain-containing protein [Verrucomicrobiota bacterium sgz303538]
MTSAGANVRLVTLACAALLVSGCLSVQRLQRPLPAISAVHSTDFSQATGSLLGASFLAGNRVTTLSDGDEIFSSMLAAIQSAGRTITFESYVFRQGGIADRFVAALIDRARAGVEVKVILDGVGALGGSSYYEQLRKAGVQLEIYHPVWAPDFWRINYRTHRKLLVIDGKIGFIGGAGVSDQWRGRSADASQWRDLHYKIEGPAVAQMQAAFASNWFKVHEEVLLGPGYFPALPAVGPAKAGVFYSAPQRGRYSVGLMYHLAIAGARKSLRIENAYFVPDNALTDALCAAAKRGVKVQVIMPGRHIDFSAVRFASRRRWPRLLAAGVELYEFRGTMLHSKLLVADELFVSVGSANFDPRSLAINDEANLIVLDSRFAREQVRIFEQDLARSRPVNVKKRSLRSIVELPVRLLQMPFEHQL